MDDPASAILFCFPCFPFRTKRSTGAIYIPAQGHVFDTTNINQQYVSEKLLSPSFPISSTSTDLKPLSTSEAATSIVALLFKAPTNTGIPSTSTDQSFLLATEIQSIVRQTSGGWSQYLAQKILSKLETVIKAGKEKSGAIKDAYDTVCATAEEEFDGFTAEHPLATAVCVTIVAIGILVVLVPYGVEILGFGELGILEGSWAAAWQSTYRGFVPKRSLFSYLQKLGMVWKRV